MLARFWTAFYNALFKTPFQDSVSRMTQEQLEQSEVRLFQVRLEKESAIAEETKLVARISRLKRDRDAQVKASSASEPEALSGGNVVALS